MSAWATSAWRAGTWRDGAWLGGAGSTDCWQPDAWAEGAWRDGCWATHVAPPIVVTARGAGWLPPRRTREYEEWLRALAEGREYVPDDAQPPVKRRPKPRTPVKLPDLPFYTGDFVADLAAQPAVRAELDLAAAQDWIAAYRAARRDYAKTELRRLADEDEIALILMLAA